MLLATVAITLLAAYSETASKASTADGGWRPCRAVNRRRNDDIPSPTENAESDGYGGGFGHQNFDDEADDDDDDDESGENEDDYFPSFHEDEKPKRGVRVSSSLHNAIAAKNNNDDDRDENNNSMPYGHHKKSIPYPTVTAGNGLRMDATSLFRNGETVDLPTYVNIPVTLRCKFVPSDKTNNKFETIVESMHPGHANSAELQQQTPPSSDLHTSRLLGQLLSSTNGWRGVVNNAVRPVRRVIDNRLARPVRLANFKNWEEPLPLRDWYDEDNGRRRYVENGVGRWNGGGITGSRWYGQDVMGRQIAARQRAADRMHRFRNIHQNRQWLPEKQPEDGQEPVEKNPADHQLSVPQSAIEEDQSAEPVDDQQTDDSRSLVQVNDDRPFEQLESGQQFEQLENNQSVERVKDDEMFEQLESNQQFEPIENSQTVEQVKSGQSVEDVEESQPGQRFGSSKMSDQVDDRMAGRANEQAGDREVDHHADDRAADRVDDRANEPTDDRATKQVDDYGAQGKQTENWADTTTDISDYVTFFSDIPVKNFVKHVITTPSAE